MNTFKTIHIHVILLFAVHATYPSQKKMSLDASHHPDILTHDSADDADISSSECEIETTYFLNTEQKMSITEKDRHRAVQSQRDKLLNEILAAKNINDLTKLQEKAWLMKTNINNGHVDRPSWTRLQPKVVQVYGRGKARSASC